MCSNIVTHAAVVSQEIWTELMKINKTTGISNVLDEMCEFAIQRVNWCRLNWHMPLAGPCLRKIRCTVGQIWADDIFPPLPQKALMVNFAVGDSSWRTGAPGLSQLPDIQRQSTRAGCCEMPVCDFTSCGTHLKSKLRGCWMCSKKVPTGIVVRNVRCQRKGKDEMYSYLFSLQFKG